MLFFRSTVVLCFSILTALAAETPAYQPIMQALSALAPLQSGMAASSDATATMTVDTAAGLLKHAQLISEKIDKDQEAGNEEPMNNNAVWQVLMQAKGLIGNLDMEDPTLSSNAAVAYAAIDAACTMADMSTV